MADLKDQTYFLKDLKPNMKRVSCVFIVLELGPTTRTKDGNEVRTAKVADRTGTINLSVWNENSALIAPCDVLQLIQGNTTVRGGCLTLNVGRFGQLVKIGEFCFPFTETPDLSAFNEEWLAKTTDGLSAPKKPAEPAITK
ncbi:SOSS complex subunit B1 [Fasciola gigantica]|uniref:SOSS complex subunit B1 n=1 Tax=Fasciola gigantica TaxID=46835 RepID=A0A504YZ21_FASGI|nr:SOSS complex subunit B1 [Fasciola gigantica]